MAGFYAPEVREQLAAMLRDQHRLLYELECITQEAVASFEQLRDGRLNKRLAILTKLDKLDRTVSKLGAYIQDTKPEPDEFDADVLAMLGRFRAGLSAFGETARGSEGKNKLARDLIQRFRVAASRIWHEATGERCALSKPNAQGEPVGDYSRFMAAAVRPVVHAFNRQGCVIVDKWRKHYDVLSRSKIQDDELLGSGRKRRR